MLQEVSTSTRTRALLLRNSPTNSGYRDHPRLIFTMRRTLTSRHFLNRAKYHSAYRTCTLETDTQTPKLSSILSSVQRRRCFVLQTTRLGRWLDYTSSGYGPSKGLAKTPTSTK